jgi:hypothetical protein
MRGLESSIFGFYEAELDEVQKKRWTLAVFYLIGLDGVKSIDGALVAFIVSFQTPAKSKSLAYKFWSVFKI